MKKFTSFILSAAMLLSVVSGSALNRIDDVVSKIFAVKKTYRRAH